MASDSTENKLRRWAYILLGYTILVILWGAWVRISHSGDGCGDTWPLCQGKVVPDVTQVPGKTWVEYAHRFTSGLYGIFVLCLFIWVRKLKLIQNLDSTYRWCFWVLVFMITEALLGAKLVLFGLVNADQSLWRLLVMSLHQLNSFMLVGFTVRFLASTFEKEYHAVTNVFNFVNKANSMPVSDTKTEKSFFSKTRFLVYFLIIAVTGAWASLSTTLFPSTSLLEGLAHDIEFSSHLVLKIRILHPLLGIFLGGSLSFGLYKISSKLNVFLGRIALIGSGLIALGIVIGFMTLTLLSPIPLKLIHLLLAHSLWSTAVFFYHFYSMPNSAQVKS